MVVEGFPVVTTGVQENVFQSGMHSYFASIFLHVSVVVVVAEMPVSMLDVEGFRVVATGVR